VPARTQGDSVSNAPVVVVITYQTLPGKSGEARRELASLIAEVVAREPDCLAIRMHQDSDDETRLMLYEEWTSREAFAGPHMQTPHITRFINRAPAFFAGAPATVYWQITGDLRR
jgi:quinol monooxygenase YgiN